MREPLWVRAIYWATDKALDVAEYIDAWLIADAAIPCCDDTCEDCRP